MRKLTAFRALDLAANNLVPLSKDLAKECPVEFDPTKSNGNGNGHGDGNGGGGGKHKKPPSKKPHRRQHHASAVHAEPHEHAPLTETERLQQLLNGLLAANKGDFLPQLPINGTDGVLDEISRAF